MTEVERIAELSWFDPIDFEKEKIANLSAMQMLELLKILNAQMIQSTENWDGG